MPWGASFIRARGGPANGDQFGKTAKQVNSIMNRHLAPVGEAAAAEAKGFINIAGTQRTWSGAWPTRVPGGAPRTGPGRGRVDTGEMRDAIDFRVTHGSGIGIEVGWIRNPKEYYAAQEHGFYAGGFRADQFVEGMGMFQHLRVYTRVRVLAAADDIMKEIRSGL